MNRRQDEIDERDVQELIGQLRDEIPAPSSDELRAIANSAAAAERSPQPPPFRRRLGLRWATAAVGIALLAGSGLGFGLGSSVTPAGNATQQPVALGFLPARGWTVMQSGTPTPTGTASSIAANVRVDPSDRTGDIPYSTLASLPSNGVVIWVTFTARGDRVNDLEFPAGRLPLQIGAARPVSQGSEFVPPRGVTQHRLRAAVAGYNVDARIFYGSAPSSRNLQDAAQDQLDRLVVASERVTIFARPTTITWGQAATIFGAVENGKAGESVDIQVKECGGHFFRAVTAAHTGDGGSWTGQVFPGVTAAVRAVWNGSASQPVTIHQRAGVLLDQNLGREYRAAVVGRAQFWHRRVLIQQRRQGAWRPVRSVILTKTEGGGGYVWSSGYFKASFPKGSLIRAVFPVSQARPCLLGGVSNSLRTRG